MPRGGARVGAGQKPKLPIQFPGTLPAADVVVPEPPADMVAADDRAKAALLEAGQSVDVRPCWRSDIWRELAPSAAANGTLVDGTLAGFRHLVELTDKYLRMEAKIDAEGWTVESELMGSKAHPLWGRLIALAMRRETALRSYGLLGNGKPVQRAAAAPVSDPWKERERRKA